MWVVSWFLEQASIFGLLGHTSCCNLRWDGFWKWALPAFFYVRISVVTYIYFDKEFFLWSANSVRLRGVSNERINYPYSAGLSSWPVVGYGA